MKNIKLILPIAVLFAVGCQKTKDVTTRGQDFNTTIASAKATEQLALAKKNINKAASSKVMLVSYRPVGVVGNTVEKQALLDRIFAPDTKTVVGLLNYPDQIRIIANKDIEHNPKQQQLRSNLITSLYDSIQTGDEILELKWLVNGKETLTTAAISSMEKGIIWDNFLYNLYTITVTEEQGVTDAYNPATDQTGIAAVTVSGSCPTKYVKDHKQIKWSLPFGGTAALSKVSTTGTWSCASKKYTYIDAAKTIKTAFGYSAEAKYETSISSDGKFGRCKYAIAVSGPGGDIEFNFGVFKFTIKAPADSDDGIISLPPQ